MNTVILPVKGLNFAGCAREIEKNLGKLETIKLVEASYVSQSVTITYDENKLSEVQLHEMVKDCGFACGAPLTRFAEPIATISRPTVANIAQPVMAHPAMEHHTPAEALAKMEMGIVDHSMMGHDMSDPAMARAMEADMRNRFFVSLILTVPVVLYSPLGVNLFKLHLPTPFVTKMKQNLFWAVIYNVIAIPVAAGVLYPFGILLAPEVGALAMSASSITVATNAVLLKSVEKKLRA